MHYFQIFAERFKNGDKKEDLERGLSATRAILDLSAEQGLSDERRQEAEQTLATILLTRFRLSNLSGVEDAEESANILKSLVAKDPRESRSNALLFDALYGQATFHEERATQISADSGSTMLEHAMRALGCLSEARSRLSVGDNEFLQAKVQLKMAKCLSEMALRFSSGHDTFGVRRLLSELAKGCFKGAQKLEDVLSFTFLQDAEKSDIHSTMKKTYHNLHISSNEVNRQGERHSKSGPIEIDESSPEVIAIILDSLEAMPRNHTTREGLLFEPRSPEDLRAAIRYMEDIYAYEPQLNVDRQMAVEFRYTKLSVLLKAHLALYIDNCSQEAGNGCWKYAQLAYADFPSPIEDSKRVNLAHLCAMAFLSHFLSGVPHNVESLRKAADIICFVVLENDTKGRSERLACLGSACKTLFDTTHHMPTIDAAIYFMRQSVEFSESRNPMLLDRLARTLRSRHLFLQSAKLALAGQQYPDASVQQGPSFNDIFQVRCYDPRKPSPELLAALHTSGNEGDTHSETLHLLDEALDQYRNYFDGRARAQSLRGSDLDYLSTLVFRAHVAISPSNHEISIAAFKEGMSLLHHIVISPPSLRSKRSTLANGRLDVKDFMTIPLQAASYVLACGNGRLAVEFLEYGRWLIWTGKLGLRVAKTQLCSLSEDLQSRFASLCDELEIAGSFGAPPDSLTPIPSLPCTSNRFMNVDGIDLPCDIQLTDEFGAVVGEIRKVPGYEDFLQILPFEKLQPAAREGPVIILMMITSGDEKLPNHGVGHAIIVLDSQDPVVVPLAGGQNIEDKIVGINTLLSEVHGTSNGSNSSEEVTNVLKGIGNLFVKDIVSALQSLGVRKHSRIWWCPTSTFSALPIHAAMWQDQTDEGQARIQCIADFYISSYTPSLASLIQARSRPDTPNIKHSDPCSHTPLLIVGQRDERLAKVEEEIENIILVALEAGHTPDTLTSFGSDLKIGRDQILYELRRHGWVHLACHGILNANHPFSSHFQIGEGTVTLMDIIKSKSSITELAFLSDCHSANQVTDFAPDEALHLASAMQLCGVRSVVGTMWTSRNEDQPRIAKAFYEYMYAESKEGEEVGYTRSAQALNKITRMMRNDEGYGESPERWAGFIHIGA